MTHTADNRAALLTPPGEAAIAVVRLCGPLVGSFAQVHLSRPPKAHRCVHVQLRDGEHVIDDPVVVRVNDQTLDISLHGGRWVIHECLELARRHGFMTDPTDITFPEVADLIEREMLAAVPLARTEQALSELLDQPRLWQQLQQLNAVELKGRLMAMGEDRSLWWMLNPPRIAIVGVPNAGKSTLANQLFGQERSITADVPGTTRDWVGDWANLDGLAVHLLDTPGLRSSDDPIEQAAIAASDGQIARADLVIVLIDPTQPEPPQRMILRRFTAAVVAVNKSDLAPLWELHDPEALRTVASTGAGVDELRQAVLARFGCDNTRQPVARWWTLQQRTRLERAIRSENPADVIIRDE